MKSKILVLMLVVGGSLFAQSRFSIGIGGGYGQATTGNRAGIMPRIALMCYTAPLRDLMAARVALDIGVKIPPDSMNGLNSMVSTTINRGRERFTGTARNYGNITRRNSGNCATSNGTSGTVISTLETVQPHGSARDGFYYRQR